MSDTVTAQRHVVDVFFAAVLLTVAVVAIVHPAVIIRWAQRAHLEFTLH